MKYIDIAVYYPIRLPKDSKGFVIVLCRSTINNQLWCIVGLYHLQKPYGITPPIVFVPSYAARSMHLHSDPGDAACIVALSMKV